MWAWPGPEEGSLSTSQEPSVLSSLSRVPCVSEGCPPCCPVEDGALCSVTENDPNVIMPGRAGLLSVVNASLVSALCSGGQD